MERQLTGIIVGCTKHGEDINGLLKSTIFSVQSEDGQIKEMRINGLHENLLPKRRIKVSYFESTVGNFFADNYSLLDDKGNEIYTRSSD